MRGLGRFLQFAGLVLTGIALFVGILGHNVRRELLLAGVGAAVFLGGHALQRSGR